MHLGLISLVYCYWSDIISQSFHGSSSDTPSATPANAAHSHQRAAAAPLHVCTIRLLNGGRCSQFHGTVLRGGETDRENTPPKHAQTRAQAQK